MRVPTWTITQFFHQTTKLEATPSVKTCVSNTLKESLGQRQEHPALDNWKRLEHQAPGDWLLQKILQVKKKVHLHPNDDGRNTSGSSAILHTISSRRSTNFTIKCWTVHVQELVNIVPIFKISRSTLRFGANLQATAYELHLGLQRITKTSKDLRQAVQRQVKTLINRKDAHNKQILKDWNTFPWSRIMLLSDPAAELIRMKVHVSDSILCVGVSNPNASNNWATKWQPEKCDSFGTYLQLLRPFKLRSILKKT